MSHCAYIYTPKLSEPSVRSLVVGLAHGGVALTHLGKSDPPKKWSGDEESAVHEILSGTDLTNQTFLRDGKSRVGFSIEMHRDPRWEHDTISFSGPEVHVRQIAESLAHEIEHYVAVIGLMGGGKTQAWEVVSFGQHCPATLRKQFTNAEQDACT